MKIKRVLTTLAVLLCCAILSAQDFSQFRPLGDSLFQTNKTYQKGNKYQRDAMLFVDMLADTHPYYVKAERRNELMAGQKQLLKACGKCKSDSAFVDLLIATLGDLHDKHTEIIDLQRLEAKRKAADEKALNEIAERVGESIMDFGGDLFHFVILPEHSLCYLQFNLCADARTQGDEALPRWDAYIDSMFTEMKAKNIANLVVDAQYNNGGSSMLCDELLIRLLPLKDMKMYTTSLRFSNLLATFNPRIGVAKQAWEADGHTDELYPMPIGNVPPTFVQPDVWSGKVIFVQSERTYSSAGILMTMVRDNHIGMIVGESSSFSPSHYGEILPYRLPNTGVLGTISCKFFARPDADHVDDKTLEPDVRIDLSNKQTAWEQILRLIEK